jgi:hypothetical protein
MVSQSESTNYSYNFISGVFLSLVACCTNSSLPSYYTSLTVNFTPVLSLTILTLSPILNIYFVPTAYLSDFFNFGRNAPISFTSGKKYDNSSRLGLMFFHNTLDELK